MVLVRNQGVGALLLYCRGNRCPNGLRYSACMAFGVGVVTMGAVVGLERPYNLFPNVILCNIYRRDQVRLEVEVSWMD